MKPKARVTKVLGRQVRNPDSVLLEANANPTGPYLGGLLLVGFLTLVIFAPMSISSWTSVLAERSTHVELFVQLFAIGATVLILLKVLLGFRGQETIECSTEKLKYARAVLGFRFWHWAYEITDITAIDAETRLVTTDEAGDYLSTAVVVTAAGRKRRLFDGVSETDAIRIATVLCQSVPLLAGRTTVISLSHAS